MYIKSFNSVAEMMVYRHKKFDTYRQSPSPSMTPKRSRCNSATESEDSTYNTDSELCMILDNKRRKIAIDGQSDSGISRVSSAAGSPMEPEDLSIRKKMIDEITDKTHLATNEKSNLPVIGSGVHCTLLSVNEEKEIVKPIVLKMTPATLLDHMFLPATETNEILNPVMVAQRNIEDYGTVSLPTIGYQTCSTMFPVIEMDQTVQSMIIKEEKLESPLLNMQQIPTPSTIVKEETPTQDQENINMKVPDSHHSQEVSYPSPTNTPPHIPRNLPLSQDKLKNLSKYHGNMVRKFPQKERSAKEQERRDKNTLACRQSRFLKKVQGAVIEEQFKINMDKYQQIMEETSRLRLLSQDLTKLRKSLSENTKTHPKFSTTTTSDVKKDFTVAFLLKN